MSSMSIWHWLIVLAVVILVFGTKKLAGFTDSRKSLSRMPVYSAETTRGDEAEFIRDRLPTRLPMIVVASVALAICVTIWWLSR